MESFNSTKNQSLFLIFILLIWPCLSDFVYGLFLRIGIKIDIFILTLFLYVFYFIIYFKSIFRHLKSIDIIFFVLFGIISILSFLFTNYNYFTQFKLFELIFTVFPFYLIGVSSIKLNDNNNHKIYLLATITIFLNIIYVFHLSNSGRLSDDNMHIAYNIMPLVCIVFCRLFEKFSFFRLVIAIISATFLFILGTRGPVFCFLIFIFLYIVKKKGLKKCLLFMVPFAIMIFFFMNSSLFITFLEKCQELFKNMGLSTRIFDMFLDNNLTSKNGRNAITEIIVSNFSIKNLFIGFGLFSDREFTRGLYDYEYYVWYEEGTYAHNVLLEFMCNFGIILGLMILLILILLFLFAFIKTNKKSQNMFIILLVSGFLMLFMSNSYIECRLFFYLIGLSLAIIRESRKITKNQGGLKND